MSDLTQPIELISNSFSRAFLVNAFGVNGMGLEALELFQRMPNSLLDDWTYVSLLNACSHAGLVDQALQIFLRIPSKTQMIYAVMVSRTSFVLLSHPCFIYSGRLS